MTKNEAYIVGLLIQELRAIKRYANLLHKETEIELEQAFKDWNLPITFEDFSVMETAVAGIARQHGYTDIAFTTIDALVSIGMA